VALLSVVHALKHAIFAAAGAEGHKTREDGRTESVIRRERSKNKKDFSVKVLRREREIIPVKLTAMSGGRAGDGVEDQKEGLASQFG
jgi:hypothetical protein